MELVNHDIEILNKITFNVIGCAYEVHCELGPGLLESTYEVCVAYLLSQKGYKVRTQVALPVVFREIKLEAGYRIDILVDEEIIVEIKAVDALALIHTAQLLTYLKLSKKKLGLLINFNVTDLKTGIHRLAN